MRTKFKTIGFLTLGAAFAAHAQSSQPVLASEGTSSAPPLSAAEQTINDIKNPASWLSWGADLRSRNEYYNNDRSLSDKVANHEQDYFRFRARIWTSIKPIDDLSFNVRLTTEPREYIEPSNSGTWEADHLDSRGKYSWYGHRGWDWSYAILDQMNVRYTNAFSLPAAATVGRQDISLGDNWLTGDGTPLDGSTTMFMDAARLTYNFKDQDTVVDAIGVMQYARANAWLPTINEQNRALCDQNEKGAIFNVNNTTFKFLSWDFFFLYKNDSRYDSDILDQPTGMTGDNANIYTVGGRVYGLLTDNIRYSAEGAYQFGEKQDLNIVNDDFGKSYDYRTLDAFGVNSSAFYMFKDSLNDQVGLSYEYLTGDNPNTKNDEMFDIMWGRYPRWTDLYTFTLTPEGRIAQYGNYHRVGPTWTLKPTKKLDVSTSYFLLLTDQDVPTRASASNQKYFDGGIVRGQYLQEMLRYKFNSHLSALLQGELFFPGDYYTEHPLMSFVRAEINLTF